MLFTELSRILNINCHNIYIYKLFFLEIHNSGGKTFQFILFYFYCAEKIFIRVEGTVG